MLKNLTIDNHESHKHTDLPFSPGLNIFIGATDAGKSSAFRSAYWLFFNRPLGDQMFPLFWEGTTVVKGEFADPDASVSRMKGKDINHYQLNNDTPINAGAGAPPAEIAEAILLDDVNFQTQVDRSYLMFETAGERGRILNRIAGLDDIDHAISNALSDEQKLSRDLKAAKALNAQYEEELVEYEDIEAREESLNLLDSFELFARKSERRAVLIRGKVVALGALEVETKSASLLLLAEKEVESLSAIPSEVAILDKRSYQIKALIHGIRRTEKGLKEADHLPEMEKAINLLNQQRAKLQEHQANSRRLSRITGTLILADEDILKKKEEIAKLGEKRAVLLAEMPEKCLTCGADIDKESNPGEI